MWERPPIDFVRSNLGYVYPWVMYTEESRCSKGDLVTFRLIGTQQWRG